MRKVLQLDGGGIRGIIPLSILVEIERQTGRPCYQIFDLMTGTSTGSIIAGMLACGVPAITLYNLYVKDGKKLFKKNGFFKSITGPKYDRSDILKTMYDMVRIYGKGSGKMGDVRTNFLSTTFNGVTHRTHFQMSWDDYHKELDLVQVIAWSSLSAVHYFGPICVPDYKYTIDYQVDIPYEAKGAVFYDGGQGRNNCTLSECITTCVIKDYLKDDQVHILSLGTGNAKLYTNYNEAVKSSKLNDLKNYLSQARNEGVYDQLHKAKALAKKLDNLKVYRLDSVINKNEEELDALKFIPNFVGYGNQLIKDIPKVFVS